MKASEKNLEFAVPVGGMRIDLYLARAAPTLSRSFVKKLIDDGLVRIGDKAVKASHKVAAGESILVTLPEPRPAQATAEEMELAILHEDEYLVAIAKPAGIVVHPAPGHGTGTLVNGLLHQIKDLSGIGGVMRPGIVHRLDKDTSGVLLVAKNDATHRALQVMFKERAVKKTYLALVAGRMSGSGTVETSIGRHPIKRKKFAAGVAGGRPALTRWRALVELKGATLLEVGIETGRTHQIRVHLSSVGHPVVNDPLYGGSVKTLEGKARAALAGLKGQALHAWKLALIHPGTGEQLSLEAPPPQEFRDLLRALGAKEWADRFFRERR